MQDERESDGRVEGRGGDGIEGVMVWKGATQGGKRRERQACVGGRRSKVPRRARASFRWSVGINQVVGGEGGRQSNCRRALVVGCCKEVV